MARTINKSVFDSSIYDIEHDIVTRTDIKNTEKWSNIEQWEPGVVLDIILDDSHPLFNTEINNISLPSEFPVNSQDKPALNTEKFYGEIGMIFVRLCYSQQGVANQNLTRAYPLEKECTSYPLLNEVVSVINYFGVYYYTNKINYRNFTNANADFRFEQTFGFNTKNEGVLDKNGNVLSPIVGPLSTLSLEQNSKNLPFNGVLGKYFWFNNKIRNLQRYEGDTVLETRFGQSIRFGSYDDNRGNDVGGYSDYKNPKGNKNPFSGKPDGGGNPMILIRNRQRPLVKNNNPKHEANVGGYIVEDINNDGSSIHITSGLTESKFKTTVTKAYFSKNKIEEQSSWSPVGCTPFTFPKLTGDQIVVNSDRLVFQSRAQETIHFSKKRYMIVTDDEYTVDAHKQIVLTSNTETVLNSPVIYLGDYNNSHEPALLGQTCVNWLYDLCNLLIAHTHWYAHTHPPSPRENPATTQALVQLKELIKLRDSLHTMLSRRVFITGGGFAPGHNGGNLHGATSPVSVSGLDGELSPSGIPGGWHGKSRRMDNVYSGNDITSVTAPVMKVVQDFINANISTMTEADLKNIANSMIDASLG